MASTLYEQTDASGQKGNDISGIPTLIGSFTTDNLIHTIGTSGGTATFTFSNQSGYCYTSNHFSLLISTTPTYTSGAVANTAEVHNTDNAFYTWTEPFINADYNFNPNTTYYVFMSLNCGYMAANQMFVKADVTNINFAGSITDMGPPSLTPKFISFSFSTTTDEANITGYWEATTTPHINQRLTFWQYTALFGKTNYQQIIATTTGYFNFSLPFTEPTTGTTTTSTTTAVITPSYVLNASLDQFDNTLAASLGYPDDSIDYNGYKVNFDATSTIISSITLDYTATLQALLNYPEYECSITSLTGCFKNALIFLFYPTADTIVNYYKLLDLVQSKPPVGYFTLVKSNINNLSATSTKAFNVVIPSSLKTYIFSPFDIGIGAILWFFFIMNFYKRLKHITI